MKQNRFRIFASFSLVLIVALGLAPQLVGAANPIQVGIAPAEQNTLEFIGQIDQDGTSFTSYGYATYVYGLPDTLLFTDVTAHTEATAQITYYATATANAGGHAALANIIVHDSTGTITFYFNQGTGSNFKDPKSFASGLPIVTAKIRSQDILNVQGLNTGIATGISEFTQSTADPFTIQGQAYQLGKIGQIERFTFVGEGSRPAAAPHGTIVIAGYAVVTGQAGAS